MNTNDAIKILKENGLKYTDKRKDMLDIFVEEDKYINAKYIQQWMKIILEFHSTQYIETCTYLKI